jgi:hypothetical protein
MRSVGRSWAGWTLLCCVNRWLGLEEPVELGNGDLEAGRHQGVDDEDDEEEDAMATEKQKQAARRNLTKARAAQSAPAKASGCRAVPRA